MSTLTPTTLLIPRPRATQHVTVQYELSDPAVLLALAREVGAVVGHRWEPLRPYAYVTQQLIGGEWVGFVNWGDYNAVMYEARCRFDAPPLDGLEHGDPPPETS